MKCPFKPITRTYEYGGLEKEGQPGESKIQTTEFGECEKMECSAWADCPYTGTGLCRKILNRS